MSYSFAGLRTLGNPVVDTRIIETQLLFLATGLGIVETDAFDVAAISRATAIAYHHVVKRAFLGTTALQNKSIHDRFFAIRQQSAADRGSEDRVLYLNKPACEVRKDCFYEEIPRKSGLHR